MEGCGPPAPPRRGAPCRARGGGPRRRGEKEGEWHGRVALLIRDKVGLWRIRDKVGLRLVGGLWHRRAAVELVAAGFAHTRTGCSRVKKKKLVVVSAELVL